LAKEVVEETRSIFDRFTGGIVDNQASAYNGALFCQDGAGTGYLIHSIKMMCSLSFYFTIVRKRRCITVLLGKFFTKEEFCILAIGLRWIRE